MARPTRTGRGSSTRTTSISGSPTARPRKNVLFIGLGGGSAPKRMWRDFPDLRLQVVELDPEVVNAAYRWFELPRSPRLTVDADDGRQWLTRHRQKWDVIVIDAFYADSIPFHLATHEFLELVRERLSPGGVVVVNVIGAVTGEESKLLRSLTKTYRSVVPDGAPLPGLRERRRPQSDLHPQRDPRRDRRGGSDDGVPAAALEGDPQGDADRPGARQRDRRPLGPARCASTTCPSSPTTTHRPTRS